MSHNTICLSNITCRYCQMPSVKRRRVAHMPCQRLWRKNTKPEVIDNSAATHIISKTLNGLWAWRPCMARNQMLLLATVADKKVLAGGRTAIILRRRCSCPCLLCCLRTVRPIFCRVDVFIVWKRHVAKLLIVKVLIHEIPLVTGLCACHTPKGI